METTFAGDNCYSMEVKYNALEIKCWLIQNISPMGWSTLIARAMPELLEVNPRFSAYYVGKKTKWGADEIFVLRWYLLRMHKMDLPEQILDDATTVEMNLWKMENLSFFEGTSGYFKNLKSQFKNLFSI